MRNSTSMAAMCGNTFKTESVCQLATRSWADIFPHVEAPIFANTAFNKSIAFFYLSELRVK